MRFCPTELAGVVELELEPNNDERGFFARLFCPDEFAAAGIVFAPTQMNLSRNRLAHTLRGMHFQSPPFAEAKVVRAVAGSVFDVVVDLRPGSPSRGRWIGIILEAKRGNALFVPEGFAHGFQTLEADTDVLYQMGRPYAAGHARGFRFDDPSVGIAWPHPPRSLSPVDACWPMFPACC